VMEQKEKRKLKALGIFCGSSTGRGSAYTDAAIRLATLLVQEGITMVYGGGNIGLMGVMADEMIRGGGHVIGVIPAHLLGRELGHPGVPDMRIVEGMAERKALMEELSDAFLAMPGGYGTLDEIFEMITHLQLGVSEKPCGLLNTLSFWDPLVGQLDHCVDESFISRRHRDLLVVHSGAEVMLDELERRMGQVNDLNEWIAELKQKNRY